MPTEKLLIDANAFYRYLEEIRQIYLEEDTLSSNFAAELIETVQDEYLKYAPTADAVEVVRCQNCIYRFEPDDHRIVCGILGGMSEINEESFCSKGMTEEQWMELHGHELEEEVME